MANRSKSKFPSVGKAHRNCFVETTYSLPIAGTPEPLHCPWCGDNSMVSITIDETVRDGDGIHLRAHAKCQGCGLELCGEMVPGATGSYTDVAIAAAKQWNARVENTHAEGGAK